ncbi:hypothetical protein C789_5051 [Microcystis aeruginosa FACHB-905 = DIANCHI905]|uniref:Uncharacterized protein n=1 Tax=Microcystis aeruginosa PCC 7806SL TaxID=1903187 RepID=A0AB33BWU2_MICA7|nr:hypothetical protein BH695_5148 [Microcystis aeruginosa PCC 7806SL]ELS45155.1 hypothetical protein C789_5051 [Microcystis aeruginosa FACHB-905 = DIANCHI905]
MGYPYYFFLLGVRGWEVASGKWEVASGVWGEGEKKADY